MGLRRLPAFCAALALSACGPASERRNGNDRITAIFKQGFRNPIVDARGQAVGTLTGRPDSQGLIVALAIERGIPAGRHAIHLHETGRCDGAGFASSGAHWNPAGRKHGGDNPDGPHDGDWSNLDIGPNGRGATERLIPRWHRKIPESGLSLLIHAGADDERTDPDGRSGARIACAVVIPVQ